MKTKLNLFKVFILSLMVFSLSSCFEIREEVTVNGNGAGTYKMVMDFSQNKQMLDMILKMSENAETNPFGTEGNPFDQVDSLFSMGSPQLNSISGISNSLSIKDDANFIYGLSFSFDNITALNLALTEMQSNGTSGKTNEYYRFAKGTLVKTSLFNLKKLTEEIKPDPNAEERGADLNSRLKELYQNITYKHIIKVQGKIKKFTNETARLSGDKKTLTLSKTLSELQAGNVNIANEIKFK